MIPLNHLRRALHHAALPLSAVDTKNWTSEQDDQNLMDHLGAVTSGSSSPAFCDTRGFPLAGSG